MNPNGRKWWGNSALTHLKTSLLYLACSFPQCVFVRAKGRQFRLALPQDDSNDSDDRRQYSGQTLFQRYTAQTRDTVESNEQSIDNNIENGASRIHPKTSKLHVCCSRLPSCFHSPLPPRQKFLHVNQTKSYFVF